jgi:hypothetical protein
LQPFCNASDPLSSHRGSLRGDHEEEFRDRTETTVFKWEYLLLTARRV